MQITLIQAPCWGINSPPLALASLTAFLRQEGWPVTALDLNIDAFRNAGQDYKIFWQGAEMEFWRNASLVEKFFSEHQGLIDGYLKTVADSGSKLVGFSIYDTAMHASLLLAQRIKERFPDKIIVFGGPHCSAYMCRDFLISQPCVDAVVAGEGEETLSQLAQMAQQGGELEFCPGALVKKNGQVIDGKERPLIGDLDILPFPDFKDYPLERYACADTLSSSTSRGCVNRCIFCNEWPYWKKYRFRTGKRIFEEFKYQLSLYPQVKVVEFHDSLCNGNLKELSSFAGLLIENKLKISWAGQAIINGRMDAQLLSTLKESGCCSLDYGLESGSTAVLQRIRKGFTAEEAQAVVRRTHEAGISVSLNFMFGIPGETEDDFKQTLDFVFRNKDYIYLVNPSPSLCGIAPGTDLFNHPQEFGIAAPVEDNLFWSSEDNRNNYLVRLERFEKFCRAMQAWGIKSTYPHEGLVQRYQIIGDYYYYLRDYGQALNYYEDSLEKEGRNNRLLARIDDCRQLLQRQAQA